MSHCAYSTCLFLLWWFYGDHICILYLIIIIKSEVWSICHYLGLGYETTVCALCLFYILILMLALLRYTALAFSVMGWAIYFYYIIISHWYQWLKSLHRMYPVVIKVSCVPSDRFYVSNSLIFTIYDIKVDITSGSQPPPPAMTSSRHEHSGFRCVLTVLHLIACIDSANVH